MKSLELFQKLKQQFQEVQEALKVYEETLKAYEEEIKNENKKDIEKYELSRRLKDYRKERKMNQQDVANITGINRAYISNIENGKYAPNRKTRAKIIKLLNQK